MSSTLAAFSPNAGGQPSQWPVRFADMTRPFLSVTGTRDVNPMGATAHRTEPFRNMPAGDKYLLVIDGADHLVFDGGRMTSGNTDIARCVRMTTAAFWKAYPDARAFLQAPPVDGAGSWDRK